MSSGCSRCSATVVAQSDASTSTPSTPSTRPLKRSRIGANAETNEPYSSSYGPTVTALPLTNTGASSGGGSS